MLLQSLCFAMQLDSNEQPKEDIVKLLEPSEAGELLSFLIKRAFELVPGGGAIADLIDHGMREMNDKKIRIFLADLKVEVERLKLSLPQDYIKTADFAYLLQHVVRGVLENYQKEKLDAYRALLINSLIRINVESERKEYYLHRLNSLTTSHIIVLKVLRDPAKWASSKAGLGTLVTCESRLAVLRLLLPKYEETEIIGVMGDLYSYGLTKIPPVEVKDVRTTPGLTLISNLLTPLCKAFLDFIIIENMP